MHSGHHRGQNHTRKDSVSLPRVCVHPHAPWLSPGPLSEEENAARQAERPGEWLSERRFAAAAARPPDGADRGRRDASRLGLL